MLGENIFMREPLFPFLILLSANALKRVLQLSQRAYQTEQLVRYF